MTVAEIQKPIFKREKKSNSRNNYLCMGKSLCMRLSQANCVRSYDSLGDKLTNMCDYRSRTQTIVYYLGMVCISWKCDQFH